MDQQSRENVNVGYYGIFMRIGRCLDFPSLRANNFIIISFTRCRCMN